MGDGPFARLCDGDMDALARSEALALAARCLVDSYEALIDEVTQGAAGDRGEGLLEEAIEARTGGLGANLEDEGWFSEAHHVT